MTSNDSGVGRTEREGGGRQAERDRERGWRKGRGGGGSDRNREGGDRERGTGTERERNREEERERKRQREIIPRERPEEWPATERKRGTGRLRAKPSKYVMAHIHRCRQVSAVIKRGKPRSPERQNQTQTIAHSGTSQHVRTTWRPVSYTHLTLPTNAEV